MIFTTPLLLIFLLSTVLELCGVFLVKRSDMGYFLLFCAVRNVICFLVRDSKMAYWDCYWTSHQIMLCWMAWIAGSLCSGYKWYVVRVPFVWVIAISLLNLSWLTMPDDMQQYAWHASAIILGTCLIALLFVVAKEHRQIAIGFCVLAGSCLASSLLYFRSGSNPVPETFLWCVCLIWLLVAAKGSPQPAGTPPDAHPAG